MDFCHLLVIVDVEHWERILVETLTRIPFFSVGLFYLRNCLNLNFFLPLVFVDMNQQRYLGCFSHLLVIVDAEHWESFLVETLTRTRTPIFSVIGLFV